jgi:hypothetical protein
VPFIGFFATVRANGRTAEKNLKNLGFSEKNLLRFAF